MIDRRQRRRRDLVSTGKIGKYSLEEAIRTQPTRALYRAYDPFLDRNVAIKIVQLFDPKEEQHGDANEAFFSEAKVIGRLQHQNIVSVYDAGVGDYEGYLVMEYVDGESLLQKLKREFKLPIKQALNIALQVCRALEFANEKGVVHRDIKPSNIMLADKDNVKVVDFGISILSCHDGQDKEALTGTPSYIAPELIHGESPKIQTDLYSLTVLMYEMILGRLPYEGADAHAVMYKVINEDMQSIEEDVPESVKEFLVKNLSKNTNERSRSCAVFEDQVNGILSDIDRSEYDTGLGETRMDQMQVFEGCTLEVMSELATCVEFEKKRVGEELVCEDMLDEYICLVQGKALLVAGDKHIIVPENNWLTEKTLQKKLGSYSCKALANSLLLRVSKSNLLESSPATQAYFFSFILDRIFIAT